MSNLPLTSPPPAGAGAYAGQSPPRRRVRPFRASASLLLAAAAGEMIWVLTVPLAGLPLEVAPVDRTVGPPAIALSALLGGTAAWALLALLARFPHGPASWTGVGTVVLLVSLVGPPLSGATGVVLLALELMHLVVGGVLLVGLRRSLTPRTVTAEAS